jgi:uncharacterized OB-fold protein
MPAGYTREIPQRYRLEARKCTKCGTVHFPPRLVCACGSKEMEPYVLPSKGKVATYSVVRVGPSDFMNLVPYVVAVVELEDGTKLTCQVADAAPEEVSVGVPVTLEFRRINEVGSHGIIKYGYKAVLDRFGE